MIQHLLGLSLVIVTVLIPAAAGATAVDTTSITVGGASAFSDDVIYGGVAGTCASTDGSTPCNSCANATGPTACNQSSVYGNLKFTVSFKANATRSNTAAELYIDSTRVAVISPISVNSGTVVTLETTWGQICSAMALSGLDASCNISGTSPIVGSKSLKFGVGVNSDSGPVDTDELVTRQLKFHGIPAGATGVTQSYCTSSGSGSGVCNIAFFPGDEKAFIDSAIFNPTEPGGTEWESIAVFPIATPNGGEANAYTSFSSGAVEPIFKTIEQDGTIPDSQVTGGMANYQQYCLVYGTKNKAQNIYQFVNDPAAAPTGCVTPSEVVGLLDDKHCFISTAAFGSQDAPEVETFRKFRNEFMLTNMIGRIFVKTYYAVSPPIAEVISGHEYLKAMTRLALYPFLIFALLALKWGFGMALLASALLVAVVFAGVRLVRRRPVLLMFMILLLTPWLHAGLIPPEEKVPHPDAQNGLIRIKQDGTYVYDVPRTKKDQSSHIRFGQAYQPEISIQIEQTDASGNPTGNYNEYNFQDFYNEDSGLIIGYDYEWFPWTGNAGRLGLQAGASAMFVTGNGRLVATPNAPSRETYTFVTLPLTLGAVYRLEWQDQQMVAPYVSGGGTYVVLAEKREDESSPNVTGGFGFYGTGGLLFNLSAFDREAGLQLDSEYGIGNLWLSLEYRVIEVNSEAFGFSNSYVNAGLSFDF